MKMIKTAGKRRTRTHEESQLQRDCVAWFRMQYPNHALMLFAVPNGGGRSPVEAAKRYAGDIWLSGTSWQDAARQTFIAGAQWALQHKE